MSKFNSKSELNPFESFFETFVLSGRYLIIPMYVGLTLGMCLYDFTFLHDLIQLFKDPLHNTAESLLLGFLGLVDMTMIANLVLMITVGGYSIFVHEIFPRAGWRLPRFLRHLTTGTLKIKMGGSLIGVSSIHLLKLFINISNVPTAELVKLLIIHFSFILSAMAMAWIEVKTHPPLPEAPEEEHEIEEELVEPTVSHT